MFDAMVDNVIPMRISPADAKKRIVEAAKDSSRVRLSTHAGESISVAAALKKNDNGDYV